MILRLALITLALDSLGCGAAAAQNKQHRGTLLERARFDMSCQQRELTLTPLADANDVITSYGVEGCGQKRVYVLSSTSAWVLNEAKANSIVRAE